MKRGVKRCAADCPRDASAVLDVIKALPADEVLKLCRLLAEVVFPPDWECLTTEELWRSELHRLTGGEFDILTPEKRAKWDRLADYCLREALPAQIKELESRPLAETGRKVKEGGTRGGQETAKQSKRDAIRDTWRRVQQAKPGTPVTATRKCIVRDGIASMRSVVTHTKDLARLLKQSQKKT